MNQEDKDFMTRFVMVLSVLVLLAAVFFLAARLLDVLDRGVTAGIPGADARVEERIRPVGRVVTAGAEEDGVVAAAEESEPRAAADVYGAVCAACHDTGAAGAPLKGDADVWVERLGQGFDTLLQHSIEGLGAMPARGGDPSLSDEEMRQVVVYMLEESGQSVDGAEATAAAEDTEEAAPAAEGEAVEAAASDDVAGDADAGRAKFASCSACHGSQGQGQGIFPKLAGQSAEGIADNLRRYRAGEQVGPNTALMAPNAVNLSDQDIADLAAYIETL